MSQFTLSPESRKYVYQSCVVISATTFNLAAVIAYGWSSPALPKLSAADSPIPITQEDGAWIVAFLKLGMVLSPLPSAWLMEKYGRKGTLLIGCVPLLLAWILLIVARSVHLVCTFTLLAGMALGCSYVVLPVYIAEIASDHIRGYLGILHTVMCKLGLLYIYAAGPFVSLRLMSWLGIVPVLLFLVSFVWLPESPVHLMAAGQRDNAEQALRRLQRRPDVGAEMDELEQALCQKEPQGTFKELLVNRGNRRSLLTVIGLAALLELCGSQLMLHYAQTIFEQLDSGMDARYASVMFGVVQLLASVLACFLVDTMGRRPLLLISVVGTSIANAVIGVYFTLERHTDVQSIAWLPLVAIMTIMVTYTIGILALLTVITAELFPKHLRGVAGSVKFIATSLVGLVMVLVYEVVQQHLGRDYLFFGFAAVTAAYVPFVWYMVPETKRRALNAIVDGIQARHGEVGASANEK